MYSPGVIAPERVWIRRQLQPDCQCSFPDTGEGPSQAVLDLLGRQLDRCGHGVSQALSVSWCALEVWDLALTWLLLVLDVV